MTAMSTSIPEQPSASVARTESVDDFAQRILDATLGAIDVFSIYLGDRLGWYRSLASDGPATADELADRTGTHPRYAREWLEQQAATGLLSVDDAEPPRFTLSAAGAEVLTDERSLSYMTPLPRILTGGAMQMPALLEAYRTGSGVGWAQYGSDARESQADVNRPWFEQALPGALHSVPDLDELLRTPGAAIADIGCGGAWSTLTLARTYPDASVHGFDIDAATVEMARSNVASEPEVAQRITITETDAAGLPESTFLAVFAFECIHDMPQPVEVLSAARRSLAPGGVVIVMDEAVADEFTAPGDEVERLMYGYSLMFCLPDGMNHQPSVGTGTVMRPATLRRYAHEAGFARMDVLPIENFGFFRFYRLSGG
ncbi:methyltransferase domain-containing protein [Rhodococcus sp. HNM0563]|uniref:class I SAM-dependent methyltransferase n=1 Tax=Rhodococcus sp. HNM0563 TaxID=2716339 RepID=UPI00146F48DB|nr:methyltransferase domain-containing protein [Rhodococcus sp. HNM0563]NLU63968.1 methyltransferase domain-containing protein [Rhodococcus sp. HNM0563]